MKQSNVVKKLSIWLGAITFLFGACALPIFTFINTAKADGLGTLQSNTQKQTIANVMSQCVDAVYQAQQAYLANGGTVEDMQEWYYTSDGGRPFGGIDNVTVSTGYGTGQAITGYMTSSVSCNSWNTDDFSSDVLTSFAQSVGKSDTMDIICNGDNPGIMKLQYRDGNSWKDASGACRNQPDPDTEYRYVWNDQHAAESYLNKLYDGDWYSVDNFDKSQDYYRYYEEYRTVCVNPSNNGVVITSTLDEVAPNIDTSDLGPKIPWYRDDGTVEYHQYHQKDNTKSWGMSGLASGLGGASNCNELAGIINGDGRGEDIDNRLAEAKKEEKRKSCLQKIDDLDGLTRTAQGIIDQDRHTPGTIPAEVVKNAQRVINKRFWEEDAKGEITCWIPDLSSGGSTTVKPPETPNTPSDEPSPDGGDNSNNSNGEGSGGSDVSQCLQNMGALGWIICPTSELLGSMISGIYDKIADDYLQVKVEAMDTNSGTYQGWKYFRDIANIIFAAMLLVVVFSQLTGYGISNYGIKKMLPSLIVVVVLVNISYIVCQLLVDGSNLLGYGLKSLFTNIQFNNLDPQHSTLSVIVQNLFGAFGIFIGGMVASNVVGSLTGGMDFQMWALPLILFAITTALGIIFFFVLLGIRQAAIIVLVAIAPVAIVCYALPNTKSLFDKWKKAFVALLMLFPICGALMGAGQFASSMLLVTSGGGFFFYLVAALVQVVPFFFIPSLLRNSLSALGNIGARLSTLGRTASNRINRGIRSSDAYKELDEQLRGRAANRLFHRPEKVAARREKRRNGRFGAIYRRYDDARNSLNGALAGTAAGRLVSDASKAQRRRLRERNDQYYKNMALNEHEREAIEPGSQKYDAMVSGLIDADTKNLVKDYITQYERDGQALDEKAMLDLYEEAMADLSVDENDMDARARMMSATDILMRSDDGRRYLYANGLENLSNSDISTGAISEAGKYLMNTYGKEIKKTDAPLFALGGHMAKGKRDGAGNVMVERDTSGNPDAKVFSTVQSSGYDLNRLKSHTVADFVNSDDIVHEAVQRAAQDWRASVNNDTEFRSFVESGAINQGYLEDLAKYNAMQQATNEGNTTEANRIRTELNNKYNRNGSNANWENTFRIAKRYEASGIDEMRQDIGRLVNGALSNDQVQKKGNVETTLRGIQTTLGYDPSIYRVRRRGNR